MTLNDIFRRIFSLRTLIGVVAGAALGYAYYYFIGCRGNSCPMWADPVRSSLVGAAFGFLLLVDTRPKANRKPEEESNKHHESDLVK